MITNINTAFESANISKNSVSFPERIEDKTYQKIKTMLTNIRGKWLGGNSQSFDMPCNAQKLVDTFLLDGTWPKKNPHALFPTPNEIVEYIFAWTYASPEYWGLNRTIRILEPSAGLGNIVDAAKEAFEKANITVELTCVEIDPVNAQILREKGYNVIEDDFLSTELESNFDIVIMNPPFKGSLYAKHILKAQSLLSRYGYLIAVSPTSLFETSNSAVITQLRNKVSCSFGNSEQDEIFFDAGLFEDTSIETCVITLPSNSMYEDERAQVLEREADKAVLAIMNDSDQWGYLRESNDHPELDKRLDKVIEAYTNNFKTTPLSDDFYAMVKQGITPNFEFEDQTSVGSQLMRVYDFVCSHSSMTAKVKSCRTTRALKHYVSYVIESYLQANPFGGLYPATKQTLFAYLSERFNLVLDKSKPKTPAIPGGSIISTFQKDPIKQEGSLCQLSFDL